MKNLYIDTRVLDDLNRKSHFLSEEIMMENAAAALEKHIENYFKNSLCNNSLRRRKQRSRRLCTFKAAFRKI